MVKNPASGEIKVNAAKFDRILKGMLEAKPLSKAEISARIQEQRKAKRAAVFEKYKERRKAKKLGQ
jgi:hypothetical protein